MKLCFSLPVARRRSTFWVGARQAAEFGRALEPSGSMLEVPMPGKAQEAKEHVAVADILLLTSARADIPN